MKQRGDTYNLENRQKANSHNVFYKTPINKVQDNGQRIQADNTQKKYANVFDLTNQMQIRVKYSFFISKNLKSR